MSKKKLSKLLALYLPYVVIGLVATNLGEAWRLAAGKELGDKIVSLMDLDTMEQIFSSHLIDSDNFILYSISLTYAEQSKNNLVIIWKIRRDHSCPYGFFMLQR